MSPEAMLGHLVERAEAARDLLDLGAERTKVAEFAKNAIDVVRVDVADELVTIAVWGPHEAPPGEKRLYTENRFECTRDDLPRLIDALTRAQTFRAEIAQPSEKLQ